jgi:hypothetical protein
VPLDGEREQLEAALARAVSLLAELEAILALRCAAEEIPHKAMRSARALELSQAAKAAGFARQYIVRAMGASDEIMQWHGDDLSSCDCDRCTAEATVADLTTQAKCGLLVDDCPYQVPSLESCSGCNYEPGDGS